MTRDARTWEYEQKMRGDGAPIPNEYNVYAIDDAGEAIPIADAYSKSSAALIAAAPDLFHALSAMVQHHQSSPHIGLAREALARATPEKE